MKWRDLWQGRGRWQAEGFRGSKTRDQERELLLHLIEAAPEDLMDANVSSWKFKKWLWFMRKKVGNPKMAGPGKWKRLKPAGL